MIGRIDWTNSYRARLTDESGDHWYFRWSDCLADPNDLGHDVRVSFTPGEQRGKDWYCRDVKVCHA
jgi:hypothetical protein